MKQFTTICIEIGSQCNRKCKFCPNAYFRRPNELMLKETFEIILKQLVNYSGRIELYIYNEPMLHPNIHDIIHRVRIVCQKACIMIATNGFNIYFIEDIKKLYYSGLNQLQIHCYDSEKQVAKYRQMMDSIPFIDQNKSVFFGASSKVKLGVVENKIDMRIRKGSVKLSNRSGLIESYQEKIVKALPKMCAKPFRLLNINWKGDAILCCNDYFGNITSGNVKDHSLDDLWSSELFNVYRKNLWLRNRDLPLCRTCDSFAGVYIGNILPPNTVEDFLRKRDKLRSLDYEHRSCHLAY